MASSPKVARTIPMRSGEFPISPAPGKIARIWFHPLGSPVVKIAVIAATALSLTLAGTPASAAAHPVKSTILTKNKLYSAGPLPRTKCAEKPVRANNKKLARAYINGVVACLDRTWGPYLRKAGFTFRKPRVKHVNRIPKKYCGFDVDKSDSQAWYCDRDRTIIFQLGKSWLKEVDDLFLFQTTAQLYGIHVQELVGIWKGFEDEPYNGRGELREQTRRASLQTDCLGGAFLRSVWPLKGRSTRDFRELLTLVQGDIQGGERWHGRTTTVRSWIKRGFNTGNPKSCNTWTASSSKVA